MLYCPVPELFPNKFVETQLPTKGQIFDRTGQRAVSPAGSYTGDDPARFASCPTEGVEALVRAAESYEKPSDDGSAEE